MYVAAHIRDLQSLPLAQIAGAAELLHAAHAANRRIFIFGNGGSAANASHFATDLGKGASDALGRRFKVLSLTDNVAWLTAIGNDYAYEDVFVRQMENYAEPGDLAISVSVSGDSPNCVKALSWAQAHGLATIALVGAKRGRTAELAQLVIEIPDTHYGRVEDAQMTVLHLLCYAFMELPEFGSNVI
ncbi:MAG: SIS domain-containing protein [Opitutaceae bacterium]|nr:SIS domain-containing protein [Opitutaceae bacterium]